MTRTTSIDWNAVKLMVHSQCERLASIIDKEIADRQANCIITVCPPSPNDKSRQAFAEIYGYIPHDDKLTRDRRVTTDEQVTRVEALTDNELNMMAEIVAKAASNFPEFQIFRANRNRIHNSRGGVAGFVWFRFGPRDENMPRMFQ